MDNKVQAEVVSDSDEELMENCSKDDSYNVQQRDWQHFAPALAIWNFELERGDLGYLAEEISKQQSMTLVLLEALGFIHS